MDLKHCCRKRSVIYAAIEGKYIVYYNAVILRLSLDDLRNGSLGLLRSSLNTTVCLHRPTQRGQGQLDGVRSHLGDTSLHVCGSFWIGLAEVGRLGCGLNPGLSEKEKQAEHQLLPPPTLSFLTGHSEQLPPTPAAATWTAESK